MLNRLSRGATLVAALTLLAPAGALAFTPTGVTAAPADTQAGANSNFTLHFALDEPSRDLKGFVIHLPPGEVGAVTATPLCTQAQFAAKACPANTQVGTTATHATAYPTPITGLAVDVPGKLYNLAPVGPEPARLGIRLTPAWATRSCCSRSSPCAPPTAAWTRAPTACRGPRPSAPSTSTPSTSRCSAWRATRPRASSPTRRRARSATTTVDATAYDGTQGSGSASFTPTGCDKLAFAPTLSATIEPGAKGARPTLTTVVESPAGPGQRAHRADHPSRRARRRW